MEGSAGSVGIISPSRSVGRTVIVGEDASEASEVNVNDAEMVDGVEDKLLILGIRGRFRLLDGRWTNELGNGNR